MIDHASHDRPEDESYLEVLVPCPACLGRGVDMTKDAVFTHMPGTTRMGQLACDACEGTGRKTMYLGEDALVDFVIVRLADRIPDILSGMKEEVVKQVMES